MWSLAFSEASTLPPLCVLQVICANVRELLGITNTPWSRSIADPRRDNVALFLEKKSRTGERAEALSFQRFLYDLEQWDPDVNPNKQAEERKKKKKSKTQKCLSVISYHQLSAGPWHRWDTYSRSEKGPDINTSQQQNATIVSGSDKQRKNLLSVVSAGCQRVFKNRFRQKWAAGNLLTCGWSYEMQETTKINYNIFVFPHISIRLRKQHNEVIKGLLPS